MFGMGVLGIISQVEVETIVTADAMLFGAVELPADRVPQRIILRLSDGYETSVYVHRPSVRTGGFDARPVLYVHGIQSHPGWFVGSAAHLADSGRAVFQVTRRGSGDNHRNRGHAASAEQLLDDTAAAVRFVTQQTGCSSVHLVGVSWGGKLLACFAATRHDSPVASVTLIAPGLVPRVDVSGWTKAGIALSLLIAPKKRFEIPLNDVAMFTDNEPMRQYLRDDPLRLLWATAGFFWATRGLDVMMARAGDGAIALPTTMFVAGRDRIIDNVASGRLVERLTGGRAIVRQFDAAHTLEFESDLHPFYEALVAALPAGESTV